MNEPINIILASGSENRRRLLASLGVAFSVIPSSVAEDQIDDPDVRKKVRAIARAKAQHVAESHRGIIIAADTFSVYNGRQYHKPKTREEAKRMLRRFSGRTGHVLTGVCVINTYQEREVTALSALDIQCKTLTEEEIADYVTRCPVTEWAAAHNPLDPISSSVFRILGAHPYRVEYYGLGIETVVEEFRRAGVAMDLSRVLADSRMEVFEK